MKKIFILNGSRRKKGNTAKFISYVINKLEDFEVEIAHPQDFFIKSCTGCNCIFIRPGCSLKDDLQILEDKILASDVLILASPVYFHYVTGEFKIILDRLSWWAHTFRLQGKPVVILSTCANNGHDTVINPLSKAVTFMGGNVITTANASLIPNQIDDLEWLNETSTQIAKKIQEYASLPPQSNVFIEKAFSPMKTRMKENSDYSRKHNITNGEVRFWEESDMLDFNDFSSYLKSRYGEVKVDDVEKLLSD